MTIGGLDGLFRSNTLTVLLPSLAHSSLLGVVSTPLGPLQSLAPGDTPAGLVLADGAVLDVQYHGATSRWQVKLDAGEIFSATRNASEPSKVPGAAGDRVRLAWSRDSMVTLEAQ